jgi:ribosomal protein L16 Arg81 hydroxylase
MGRETMAKLTPQEVAILDRIESVLSRIEKRDRRWELRHSDEDEEQEPAQRQAIGFRFCLVESESEEEGLPARGRE